MLHKEKRVWTLDVLFVLTTESIETIHICTRLPILKWRNLFWRILIKFNKNNINIFCYQLYMYLNLIQVSCLDKEGGMRIGATGTGLVKFQTLGTGVNKITVWGKIPSDGTKEVFKCNTYSHVPLHLNTDTCLIPGKTDFFEIL